MSDLASVLLAAAAKAATIPGIAGASHGGVTELPGAPWALVYLNAGTSSQSAFTSYSDELEVRVYVPQASLPDGYLALLAFPDLFEAAWRTDRDLGGTCLDSGVVGHGKVDAEDWAGARFLFIPIRIGVLRTDRADLSP